MAALCSGRGASFIVPCAAGGGRFVGCPRTMTEMLQKAVDGPFRVLIMRASSGAVLSENSLKIKELDEIKDCIGGGFS